MKSQVPKIARLIPKTVASLAIIASVAIAGRVLMASDESPTMEQSQFNPGTYMVMTTAGIKYARPIVDPKVREIGGRAFVAGKLSDKPGIMLPADHGKMCYFAIEAIVSMQEMP